VSTKGYALFRVIKEFRAGREPRLATVNNASCGKWAQKWAHLIGGELEVEL
jgi:hypothetical protein